MIQSVFAADSRIKASLPDSPLSKQLGEEASGRCLKKSVHLW